MKRKVFINAIICALAVVLSATVVYAATSIGSNISSGGTLSVDGAATFGSYASSTGALNTQSTLHVGSTATFDGLISGDGVTTAQQNFWNSTSTWKAYDTNWNRNYDATTTLNGFTPGDYLSHTNWFSTTTWAGGGDFSVTGNATSSGSFNVGNANEYLRVETIPYAVNTAFGNIYWIRGRALNAAGGIGIMGVKTGLFIGDTDDATYSDPIILFTDTGDAEIGRIVADVGNDQLDFTNFSGGYTFDGKAIISGTSDDTTGIDITITTTRTAADAFGISAVQTVNYDDTYNAYGFRLTPSFTGTTGEAAANAYVMYMDGTNIGAGTVETGYGLYIDALNLSGTVRNIGAYIGDNLAIATTTGGGTFSEKLTVVGDSYFEGNATTTENLTIGSENTATTTVTIGDTNGADGAGGVCLKIRQGGAWTYCYVIGTAFVCSASSCE